MHIAHIINPVKAKESSDLHIAQPVTFESLYRAKKYAETTGIIKVDLLTTQYPEDHEVIPSYFTLAPDLQRSIQDQIAIEPARKLPFLHDIVQLAAQQAPMADYIVYTNTDISLMPQFYEACHMLASQGCDAFVINRRTIPKTFADPKDLPMMYMLAGESHPGFDCFVFKRELANKIDLGKIILGAPWVGRVFVLELIAAAKSFNCFTDLHLTFHLGNDKAWSNDKFRAYKDWNSRQLLQCIERIRGSQNIIKSALAQQLIERSLGVDGLVQLGRTAKMIRKAKRFFLAN